MGGNPELVEGENLIIYHCPRCQSQIKVPKEYIEQFKSGGQEYHSGCQSHLICLQCGEMIEIK